jgi:hypothetical protein
MILATSFTLPPKILEPLPPATRQELLRALEASGTAARLRKAGLVPSDGAVEVSAEEAKAVAAFHTEGPKGLWADVYFGADGAALEAARARHHPTPDPLVAERTPANGAFLVRVVARGPDAEARVTEVASAIAGEE